MNIFRNEYKAELSARTSMESFSEPPDHQSLSDKKERLSMDSHGSKTLAREYVTDVKSRGKKTCGMSRRLSIWLTTVISTIVIIAVFLGVVLGVVVPNKNSASNPMLKATNQTGLALLYPPDQSALYAYYMDESYKIIEIEYPNGNYNSTGSPPKLSTVATVETGPVTPMAAVTYRLGKTQYRRLFFFSQGRLWTTARTNHKGWIQPFSSVSNKIATTNSLAACVDTNSEGLNGFRVYLGSADATIAEVGIDFDNDFASGLQNPNWRTFSDFPLSDSLSGVGCAIVGDTAHLYMRNETTGAIQQWTYDYKSSSSWTMGASTGPGNGPASGSTLIVVSDGEMNDYIFYQPLNNQTETVVAQYSVGSSSISAPLTSRPTKVIMSSAGYSIGGTTSQSGRSAIILNQDPTQPDQLMFNTWSYGSGPTYWFVRGGTTVTGGE